MTNEEVLALKKRLDDLSDKLNLKIAQEEVFLKELSLGVVTFLKSTDEIALGYSNDRGKWALFVRKYSGDDYYEWPLAEAPRGLRFHCVRRFPELREAIYEHAKKLADKIEKTLSLEESHGEVDEGAAREVRGDAGEEETESR